MCACAEMISDVTLGEHVTHLGQAVGGYEAHKSQGAVCLVSGTAG